jgi:hypothetical protein
MRVDYIISVALYGKWLTYANERSSILMTILLDYQDKLVCLYAEGFFMDHKKSLSEFLPRYLHYIIVSLLVALCCVEPVFAEEKPLPDTKARMAEVYRAYSELQNFIGTKEQFVDKKNQAQIAHLLTAMKDNFHQTEGAAADKFAREGLTATLKSVQQTLDDISLRFAEGKKDYALWKIRSLSNYCVTCHTRFKVANDFGSSQSASLKGLNTYQRADYFFATRQFSKASVLFREVIASDQFNFERFDALRRLLVIETRVYPDPSHALSTLKEVRQEAKFSPYEEEEIQDWTASLLRWQKEKPISMASDQMVLAEAERLLKIAHHGEDSLDGQVSFIELLRASALLHSVFDKQLTTSYHAKVLYLLGSTYSEMPHIFQSELPQMFLEECIRKFPGSDEAKKSFRVYQDAIQRDYTGSAGTRLPEEEQQKLEELKALAYGKELPVKNQQIAKDF